MEERKLVRVELTYEDGETTFLEGEEAQNWLDKVNGCCILAHLHGMGIKEQFPWNIKINLEKK